MEKIFTIVATFIIVVFVLACVPIQYAACIATGWLVYRAVSKARKNKTK